MKDGLRVKLERKARAIGRRKDAAVGILVWRFTKRVKITTNDGNGDGDGNKQSRLALGSWERPENGRVRGLRRFWEDMGGRLPGQ